MEFILLFVNMSRCSLLRLEMPSSKASIWLFEASSWLTSGPWSKTISGIAFIPSSLSDTLPDTLQVIARFSYEPDFEAKEFPNHAQPMVLAPHSQEEKKNSRILELVLPNKPL